MLKIIISGCNGHMGKVVADLCAKEDDIEVVAGFDVNSTKEGSFPVYSHPMEFSGTADAIIDFSHVSALTPLLEYSALKNIPVVLCTTGYSKEQLDEIRDASAKAPIFKSANMSLGINLLVELIKKTCSVTGSNYDVEIVERHHNRKLDAPSGTAIMLADAAASALPYDAQYIYERNSRRAPRAKNEIGISAVRGGTIVGEHEVIFANTTDEVIT